MKTLFRNLSLILLTALGTAQALSYRYDTLPSELKSDIRYGYSWKAAEAQNRAIEFFFRNPVEGRICIGHHRDYGITWNDGLHNLPEMQDEAFTLSFDLHELSTRAAGSMISIYTPGTRCQEGLHVHVTERGFLHISSRKFSNSSTSEYKARINLGEVEELLDKTITLVYNGEQNTICAYVDGTPAEKNIKLRYNDAEPNKRIYAMQWGGCYGGGPSIEKAELNNIYIWNRALTEEEVCRIVEGKLTPSQWKLIYICGGILLTLLVAAGGFLAWKIQKNRKEQEAEKEAFKPTFVDEDE